MVSYRRLTRDERYQIGALVGSGIGCRKIALQLGRAASTVCRELGRHRGERYCAEAADWESRRTRSRSCPERRKIRSSLKLYVENKLVLDWSPEQICGRLRLVHGRRMISPPTVYKYLEEDKALGGSLWKHLRILRKRRKDRKVAHWHPKEHLPGRVMIERRPKIVEHRKRLGDYERDTVRGKFNGAVLLTLVDRTSRLLKIARLRKATSELVHQATVEKLRGEPLKTITNDNGTEFANHRQTSRALAVPIYFSNAYRSWERGTNENTNGLLRQYFPKRTKKNPPPTHELTRIQNRINMRPRKCLGYRSPIEVHRLLKSSGVALAT